MSRIAPNLAKDNLDVSPLGNEFSKTNRQHIRVPFSARGIKFGTLSLPRPHNNLSHTSSSFTSDYDPDDPRIDPPFIREEPWTRPALADPIGHLYEDDPSCSRDVAGAHGHIGGDFTQNWYSSYALNNLNFAKHVGLSQNEWAMNRSKAEWESGTAIRRYYPSTRFTPAETPDILNPSSIVVRYVLTGSNSSFNFNQMHSITARIRRDDLIGVSTLSGPNLQSSMWPTLVSEFHPMSTYQSPKPAMGYRGRYWVRIQRDFFGALENVMEVRTYQLLQDRDAENSYIRRRYLWVDSAGGVKDRRMMTRLKKVQLRTFIVQTWRRQWIDDGAGGAIPLPDGVPPVVHRTGAEFSGDRNAELPVVPWITGEYPGHPTFNFSAFEEACDNGDDAAISTLVTASTFPGVGMDVPSQAQYRWHEMRFQPSAPTFSSETKRIIGRSHRVDSKDSASKPSGHPKWLQGLLPWYGDEIPRYSLPVGEEYAENAGPGDFPILHRPNAAEDFEIHYPADPASSTSQRDFTSQTLAGETIRISVASVGIYSDSDVTYHPLADVPEITSTARFDRFRKRIITQTAVPALNAATIISDPKWIWDHNHALAGQGYVPVTATAQLQPGYYGPVGRAADTQIKKAIMVRKVIHTWIADNSMLGGYIQKTPQSIEVEPAWGASPGFTEQTFFFVPKADSTYDRRWSGNTSTPGEPNSNFSFFTQQYYDSITPRLDRMFTWSNVRSVEGWNPKVKPTANPATVDFVQGGTTYKTLTFQTSVPSGIVLASRVQSQTLSVKNLVIAWTPQAQTISFSIPLDSDLGQWTFTVRAFDGLNYSDPVPVTVRVMPAFP